VKTLRTLKIRIPGKWEDAWLYRGSLILWTTESDIYWVDLDQLETVLRGQHGPHLAFLSNQLVLRSERKASSDFVALRGLPDVFAALLEPILSEPDTVLSIEGAPIEVAPIERIPGHVLDTQVYGNRVFSATDEGIYETQFSPKFPSSDSPLLQLTSHPSTSIISGAGRIAASLGEGGLISRAVDFGDGASWWVYADELNARPQKLADYSRRVSRSSVHLLNYGESSIPTFFYADTVTQQSGAFRESITTDYHAGDRIDHQLRDLLLEPSGDATDAQPDDFRVYGNANYRLLARAAGKTNIVGLLPDAKKKSVSVRHDRTYAKSERLALGDGPPLSVHALASGIAIETFEGLSVLGAEGIYSIEREQCVQVRTFPHSKRYRDTLVAVCEDHLDLVGFVEIEEAQTNQQ
jgi:hypothetical protein